MENVARDFIEKRIATIQYLLRVFQGHGLYYGTVRIPLESLGKPFCNQRKRTEMLFHLSMSLGMLLRINQSEEFVRAADTLFSQFELYQNDTRKRSKKESLLDITPIPYALDFLQTIVSVLEIINEMYTRMMTIESIELVSKLDLKCAKHVLNPILKDLDVIGGSLFESQMSLLLEPK